MRLISFTPRLLYAEKKYSRVLVEHKVSWTAAPDYTLRKHIILLPLAVIEPIILGRPAYSLSLYR